MNSANFTILHEIGHNFFGRDIPEPGKPAGPVVFEINKMRKEISEERFGKTSVRVGYSYPAVEAKYYAECYPDWKCGTEPTRVLRNINGSKHSVGEKTYYWYIYPDELVNLAPTTFEDYQPLKK